MLYPPFFFSSLFLVYNGIIAYSFLQIKLLFHKNKYIFIDTLSQILLREGLEQLGVNVPLRPGTWMLNQQAGSSVSR